MASINPEWEVSAAETASLLKGDNPPLLLDVREGDEFAMCRIEGAQLVALSEIDRRVDDVRELAGGRQIITYCHHGRRSLQAAAFLRAQGIENIKSMAGGIDAWSLEIDSTVARY